MSLPTHLVNAEDTCLETSAILRHVGHVLQGRHTVPCITAGVLLDRALQIILCLRAPGLGDVTFMLDSAGLLQFDS
jgi:hypothetical protein